MESLLATAIANLTSPAILFFVLGVLAASAKADLELPEGMGKALSIYLLLAIGFKGGVELSENAITPALIALLLAGIALSFLIPFIAFALLKFATRVQPIDAAAIAAHYGSISVVTFMAAVGFLTQQGIDYEGYMVAMLALMETPAILSGLILAAPYLRQQGKQNNRPKLRLKDSLLNGSVVLLLGSLAIGYLVGKPGLAQVDAFVKAPFYGLLCLFLLDMGLLVGRRLGEFRRVGVALVAFGLYMPLIGAALGLAVSALLGLGLGEATLLAVLCASASYIVVPAAMRLALPQAKASLYITTSLAVTFPFNVIAGIPLYFQLAMLLQGVN